MGKKNDSSISVILTQMSHPTFRFITYENSTLRTYEAKELLTVEDKQQHWSKIEAADGIKLNPALDAKNPGYRSYDLNNIEASADSVVPSKCLVVITWSGQVYSANLSYETVKAPNHTLPGAMLCSVGKKQVTDISPLSMIMWRQLDLSPTLKCLVKLKRFATCPDLDVYSNYSNGEAYVYYINRLIVLEKQT